MFITLKRKYLRKKRDSKDVNKSGTSTEVVLKAQKAICQLEFLKWLENFIALRQGKNNLSLRGANVEGDENGEQDDMREIAKENLIGDIKLSLITD